MLHNINNEIIGFINFLLEKNVFQMGLAYIIATQVNQIFSKFVTNIIYPVVNKITENKIKQESQTTILGIEFKIGDFLLSLINFFMVLFFLYYMYKISNSSKTFIENITNSIKNLFFR
jgi:large-conductance mechanosensitive channel